MRREVSLGQWLFLRLVVVTLVMGAGIVLLSLAAEGVHQRALYGCLAVEYVGLTLGYLLARRGVPLRVVQSLEIGLDVAVISACVHFTGGVSSKFALLYFIPILIAAFHLQQRGAITTALLTAVAIVGYALLAASGRIHTPDINYRGTAVSGSAFLEIHFLVALLVLTGFLAGGLASRIQSKAEQLHVKQGEMEDLLHETQRILDNMSSGVLTLDQEGRVQRVNPAAEQILGVTARELVGRPIQETLGPIMPVFTSHLGDALRDRLSAARVELNIMRRDTRVVPIGVSISQQYGPDSPRQGVIAVFQDLTDVLRMRERVRVSDRLAAMGELSAEIAHEIRNPLASIRGSVEVLACELQVEGENARLMQLILRESERLNRIIEDYLDYARLRPIQTRNCRLADLLDDLLRLLRSRDDFGPNLRVQVLDLPADLVVEIDEEQMKQVFLNIAINAFQAMEGEGTLTVVVDARPQERPPQAVVRFLDDGPGIDEEILDRIFDPFFTTKPAGTGLGLPMANRIVHSHRGSIVARNLDGRGAEFAVHLPLVGVWEGGTLDKSAKALDERVVRTS
jgi:two-component system sensor histidine kinase PilS (NtrC family)